MVLYSKKRHTLTPLTEIDDTKKDALTENKKHLNAAKRKATYDKRLKNLSFIINIIVFITLLVIGYLTQLNWLNWLAVLLVLISSIIVLMQTYLNLIPTIENHKQIAERFLILSQDYSRISATYQDKNFELADLLAALEKISEEHHKLLKEGQVFPTNYSDYREDSKKWYHFNVCGL